MSGNAMDTAALGAWAADQDGENRVIIPVFEVYLTYI